MEFTNAGGATNVDPNGSGVTLQSPIDLTSNQNILGWTAVWGGSMQTRSSNPVNSKDYSSAAGLVGGVTTVGNLLTYLHTLDPKASIPVFYADYNQTGKGDSLWMSAKAQIVDDVTGSVVKEFFLDALNNKAYDPLVATYNYGSTSLLGSKAACDADPWNPLTGQGCAGVTANGDVYDKLEHNKGSGKPDFLAYDPTMDLALYDPNDQLVVTIDLGCVGGRTGLFGTNQGCNTNGGEEFGIAGAVGTQVPEPEALSLLSVALTGLALAHRRRKPDQA